MSTQIRTEIDIAAEPEQVWDVLQNFDAYPEWNPFIPEITGPIEEGERLNVRLQPPEGKGMRFRPRVLEVAPGRALRWLGHLGIPGLFDGEHRFLIEPVGPNRVRFVQEERFSGLLVPLILRFAGSGTRRGFEAMNAALKSRVEQLGVPAQ
ncbi:MAG TPA: SRPBCC domain-containing protein [Thermomicrobiales bacterium]|nr:SRPBCC domain-containing protein [Thermomicrobiales bacterium]